jgi:uncharacterized coiled-coil protein SlyX
MKHLFLAAACASTLHCCSNESSSKQDDRQNKRLSVLEQKQEAQEILIDNLKNAITIKDSQMEQVTEELAKISDDLNNAKSEEEIGSIMDDLNTINGILSVLNHQITILNANPICKAVGNTSYKITKTLTINVPNIQCTGDTGHETIINDIDNKDQDSGTNNSKKLDGKKYRDSGHDDAHDGKSGKD